MIFPFSSGDVSNKDELKLEVDWRYNGFEMSSPTSTPIIHPVLHKLARFPGPLQRMVSEPNLVNSLQNMLDQRPEWSNLGMVQLEF